MARIMKVPVFGMGWTEPKKITVYIHPDEKIIKSSKESETILGKTGYDRIVTTTRATYKVKRSGGVDKLVFGNWKSYENKPLR